MPAPHLVPFRKEVNQDAVSLAEEILERLKSGEAIAFAYVEVLRGGIVGTGYCKSQSYHALNSGAARLAAKLARLED